MKNKINIVTPFYNPGEFLENCVNSIMSQKYDNFKVVFVDDCSTDNSWDLLPHNDNRAICVKNEIKKTTLENTHNAIMNYCDPDSIIVIVDGDDWLLNKNVLSFINDFYSQNNCLMMYGQSIWTTGNVGFAREFKDENEYNNLRTGPFIFSHIRTFKKSLYDEMAKQDPNFNCLKDKNGNFYKMTGDVAVMYPLAEIAGYDRIKFNSTPLYIYNRSNPISDDRVNQQLQWDIHAEISNKPKFKKLC